MKIGFIGLGIMGKPMCKNLLKAGHECTIYDIVEEAAREAVGAGAVKCESAAQAASGRELVITMLPNSPQVKQVVLGENGIADAMDEGCVFVDMSSIAPLASKKSAPWPAEISRCWMLLFRAGSQRLLTGRFPSWWAERKRFMTK